MRVFVSVCVCLCWFCFVVFGKMSRRSEVAVRNGDDLDGAQTEAVGEQQQRHHDRQGQQCGAQNVHHDRLVGQQRVASTPSLVDTHTHTHTNQVSLQYWTPGLRGRTLSGARRPNRNREFIERETIDRSGDGLCANARPRQRRR